MGAQAGGRPTILGTFAAGVEDDIGVCQRNGLQTVPVSAKLVACPSSVSLGNAQ